MRKLIFAVAMLAAVTANAEQKNVQLLTNLSDFQLGLVMDNMAASLGVHCDFCHVHSEQTHAWDFPSDAKQEKKTGREMIKLVLDLNEKNFKGQPRVGCYTCHLGKEHPSTVVALPMPPIPPSKPHEAEEAERKTYPAAKELLAKYVAAIGGDAAAKKLMTAPVTAKASRIGANGQAIPMEVYVSGGKVLTRTTPAEGPAMTQMFEKESGWMQGRQGVRTFTGADAAQGLINARVFDPVTPSLPETARVFSKETIDGHDTWLVGSSIDEHTRQRIWFDAATGLPVRRVITVDSPTGRIPTQTDFDDYRDVNGVKVPFTVKVSSVNGGQNATRKYTSIELGKPVDEKLFEAPPKAP
ncbi:MAG: photosynthetic reaction center cytochrome c subunit [Thermoanaerobaculia bacterium]|jgi:hypothetical protein|nr:photosynthetic reaction center cytochrome c subunit [Thermoanaerobaculia bacterium]